MGKIRDIPEIKKKVKKYLVEHLFEILSLVIQIVTAGVAMSLAINISNINIQDSSTTQSVENAIGANIIGNYTDNSSITENNYLSEQFLTEQSAENLLSLARVYYKNGKFEKVIQIYSSEKLSDNIVALCNLAHIYAYGEYGENNMSEADYLYDKAIALGSKTAFHYKFVAHMINKTENLQDIMKEAYEKKDEQIAVFIANHFEDYINGEDTDAFYYLYWLAYYLSAENFQEFVFGENQYFYTWEYVGDKYLTQIPDDTATVKYVLVDSNETAGGLSTVYKYMKFESNCRNIDSLGEKFILTDNIEESDFQ